MDKTEVVEVSDIKYNNNRVVVTGFAGAGFICNTALMSVISSEKFKQVAYVKGNTPPLMVILDGQPQHCIRFYSDAKDQLLFIVTEAVISGESSWDIAEAITDWILNKGVSEVIALEGFPSGFTDSSLFGFTTGNRVLTRHNIKPISQGAISGLNATVLEKLINHKIPWTNVFIPTPVASGIDYTGVISSINLLNAMFNLKVDTSNLKRLSDDLKNRIIKESHKKN